MGLFTSRQERRLYSEQAKLAKQERKSKARTRWNGTVHVNWRMTPDEWEQLKAAILTSDSPYCKALEAEGKLQ